MKLFGRILSRIQDGKRKEPANPLLHAGVMDILLTTDVENPDIYGCLGLLVSKGKPHQNTRNTS